MNINRRTVLIGAAVIPTFASSAFSDGGLLRDPFSPTRPRRIPLAPPGPFSCPVMPKPVRDIIGIPFYSNPPYNFKLDPHKFAANVAVNKPIADFTRGVQTAAEAYLASSGQNIDAAKCALQMFDSWASADALLGRFNEQGLSTRRWNLTGMTPAFLAIRHADGLDHDALDRVGRWFGMIGGEAGEEEGKLHNNHLNWLAAGTVASAIASNDSGQFERGINMAKRGIAAIQDNGTLPAELARGPRALNYHNFALSPLLYVCELAYANQVNLYTENNKGLFRLVDLIMRNIPDQSELEKLTGQKQEWPGPTDNNVPWVEIWARRHNDSRVSALADKLRPIIFPYMGGNQTLLFGA